MSTESRTIRIDGITYTVTVEQFGPEASASWRCGCCEEHRGGTRWASEGDEAASLAMADIWDHHDDRHVAATEPAMGLV
jgi:hypothetical protein